MNLKPYPEYRDSGVPWLGNVPKHWEVYKIRNVANLIVSNVDKHSFENENMVYLCNYIDVYKNEKITNKIKFMKATASEDEIRKFKLRIHDVIITKDSESWNDIGVPALVLYENQDFICGYHLAILRPQEKLSGQFLFRLLQDKNIATQFHRIANGVTRYGMSQNSIKDVKVLLPSLSEQLAIARFLDYKTAQIARFIKAKKRMIELLKEQKQVIINDAVTGKIDVATSKPYSKYKDSCVEWLGQVPEGWERWKFNRVVYFQEGPGLRTWQFTDNGIKVICVTNIVPPTIDFSKMTKYISIEEYKEKYTHFTVETGDILLASSGASWGKVSIYNSNEKVILNTSTIRLKVRNKNKITNNCIQYILNAQYINKQLLNLLTGSCQPNFGPTHLDKLYVALPSILEQNNIVSYIETKTAGIDLANSRTGCEIALMQEYRTRLISDVVTGKIDVRDIKIPDIAGIDDTIDESIDEPEGEEELETAEAEE